MGMITTILSFLKGNILKLVMENASKIGWVILAFLLYLGLQEYINEKIEKRELEIRYEELQAELKEKTEDIKRRELKFKLWKKQKPQVKYETVYKYKERVKDASCEEKIKAIANINFSDL